MRKTLTTCVSPTGMTASIGSMLKVEGTSHRKGAGTCGGGGWWSHVRTDRAVRPRFERGPGPADDLEPRVPSLSCESKASRTHLAGVDEDELPTGLLVDGAEAEVQADGGSDLQGQAFARRQSVRHGGHGCLASIGPALQARDRLYSILALMMAGVQIIIDRTLPLTQLLMSLGSRAI